MSVAGQVAEQTISVDDVIAASERVKVLARETPIYTSRLFNEAAGVQAFFKCENFQRGGAFKIRGATNFLLSLSNEERHRGVAAFTDAWSRWLPNQILPRRASCQSFATDHPYVTIVRHQAAQRDTIAICAAPTKRSG